jgi:hypothetical protein
LGKGKVRKSDGSAPTVQQLCVNSKVPTGLLWHFMNEVRVEDDSGAKNAKCTVRKAIWANETGGLDYG